jgi:hypothetical protein
MSDNIATNMIAAINRNLDDIERAPRMYGGPQAIEFQYEMALAILAAGYGVKEQEVREVVKKVTTSRVGWSPDTFLYSKSRSMEELIAGLKMVRSEVVSLLLRPRPKG